MGALKYAIVLAYLSWIEFPLFLKRTFPGLSKKPSNLALILKYEILSLLLSGILLSGAFCFIIAILSLDKGCVLRKGSCLSNKRSSCP